MKTICSFSKLRIMSHIHNCRRCPLITNEPEKHFSKDVRTRSGFAYVCKICVNKAVAKKHYNRRAASHSKRGRTLARENAQRRWGSASKYKCAVLDCDKMAQSLHHVDYALHESVIPMCNGHHSKLHSLEEWEERFKNDSPEFMPRMLYNEPTKIKRPRRTNGNV